MSWPGDLVTFVKANVPSIEGRFHRHKLPSDAVLPAGTYREITDVPEYEYSGASGQRADRVQIEFYAEDTSDDAEVAANELEAALSGFKGMMDTTVIEGAFLENRFGMPEAVVERDRVVTDWMIKRS